MGSIHAIQTLQTDPVAKELLASTIPARLAYTWRDGTPRVIPMWFHWTGEEILMGAPTNAPKMRVLADHPAVSLVIDDIQWPYKSLTVQGIASVETLSEAFPEYLEMARRFLGEEGSAAFEQARSRTFAGKGWVRITIRPQDVHILDFAVGQFPSAWTT
jgi:nitroimidazol reductase NimA-like FMN-containing flavoprotein (pyridoxamine 5'-phosphate oxidase superfamily)